MRAHGEEQEAKEAHQPQQPQTQQEEKWQEWQGGAAVGEGVEASAVTEGRGVRRVVRI